jgi:hypothetical protein
VIRLYKNRKLSEHAAIVDEADARRALQVRWSVFEPRGSRTKYARGTFQGNVVYLHRFIMHQELQSSEGVVEVDHIDGDGLNNTRANLRVISHRRNIREAWHRRPWQVSQEAATHIHTVKSKGRIYRYDRRTRQRLPDANDGATNG